MKTKIVTTTSKGTEGCNMSHSEEMYVGKQLAKVIPDGWTISFSWCQILMSDMHYEIVIEKKLVEIAYSKGLSYWSKDFIPEIAEKIKQLQKDWVAGGKLIQDKFAEGIIKI